MKIHRKQTPLYFFAYIVNSYNGKSFTIDSFKRSKIIYVDSLPTNEIKSIIYITKTYITK